MLVLRKCKKQQNRLVELKNSKCIFLSLCEHASCSFILHWEIPCPQNISPVVVMNCIALLVGRARVFCWGAIWFPFILMCLWHQENCWDSRGKCLHLGLQPELWLFMCGNDYLFFPIRNDMVLRCDPCSDFNKTDRRFIYFGNNHYFSGTEICLLSMKF